MGKFRAHQAKNRRKREKTQQRMRGNDAAVTVGDSNGHMRRGEPREPQVDEGEIAAEAAGAGAVARVACASKKPPKILTYSKEHSVLICGDGDFSFTRGIIRHRGTGLGVVATSLDSRETVLKKYPRAKSWLPQLDEDGAQIAHCVDATRLHETLFDTSATEDNGAEAGTAAKNVVLFDRVVFNFPHTGKQRTHLNRNLIRDFFASTRDLVKCAADGGEVHVTLKNKRPYSDWNIRAMAKESGLVLVRSIAFDPSVFPGYGHSTTDPKAKEFDAVGAKTHVFCRARSAVDDNVNASGGFPTVVKSRSVGGGGALQVTDEGEVQDKGNGGEEGDTDEDGCDMRGKAEEDLEATTSAIGGNDMFPRNGVDTVTIAGKGNERHRGKSKSSSGGNQSRDNSKSKRKERVGIGINSSVGSDSKQEQKGGGDLSDSTAAHGNEEPHAFQKKKAAKRRAQRKRAAAIKKAATEAGDFEEASVAPSEEGGSLPKRKRGKYVRPGKKHD